jgi:hypothetical protein
MLPTPKYNPSGGLEQHVGLSIALSISLKFGSPAMSVDPRL